MIFLVLIKPDFIFIIELKNYILTILNALFVTYCHIRRHSVMLYPSQFDVVIKNVNNCPCDNIFITLQVDTLYWRYFRVKNK